MSGGPSSYVFGSNTQSCAPVSASSATIRWNEVLTYTMPSIMSGVFWKPPGRRSCSGTARSIVCHVHASSSSRTFAGVISDAVEYFVCAVSPPQCGHSINGCGS